MSELEQLTNQIKRSTDYQINKKILREKVQADLHFAYNGGLFKATPEQYAFVAAWQGDPDNLFLEDTYGNPVKINIKEFIEIATEHYSKVMNAWNQEHAELRRIRKI